MTDAAKVVVTGGGTGIGLATTRLLAQRGWQVIAAGLERADDFPAAIPFVDCDVTDTASVARVFDGIDRLGGLVTCAGTIRYGREWDPVIFEKVMAVNVTGMLNCCSAARPLLAQGSGSIVNIASMWTWFGNPVAPAYGTSKGAVAALTRSLAVAWGSEGIRVNAVAPTITLTELAAEAWSDPAKSAPMMVRHPLNRFAEADEVAQSIAMLLSEDSRMVTGMVLPVDGGFLAV